MDITRDMTRAALLKLEALVGNWTTTGHVFAISGEPSAPYTAEDAYEWLPGGHFLLHRWDAVMPGGRSQGLEIIGYDAVSRTYPMHSFDSDGNASLMHARLDGDEVRFDGEAVRFRGTFLPDRSAMNGTWERQSPEGEWFRWMSVSMRRAL